MKCIHCGNDTTYPQRSANKKRCATCQHPFAFEPKTDPLSVSDTLFQKCIQEVSAEGTLQFTTSQLYYEFSRRMKKKSIHIHAPYGWTAAGMGVGGAIGMIAGFPILIPFGIVGAIAACVVGAKVGANKPLARVPNKPEWDFQTEYLASWIRTHGEIPGLLPALTQSKARGTIWTDAPKDPPDLTAYSFDRALIVDQAEVAAMLVANRFHFENNCAILSIDKGFPANGRFEQVREMLRRNPHLIVFALHNASAEGMRSVPTLRDQGWFPDPVTRIADLGLRPRHVMKSSMLLGKRDKQTLPSEVRAALDPQEASWLEEGFIAELEAMRPAKLMRAIYQAFSQMVTVGPDGGVILVDSGPGIWVGDSYGSDSGVYAADSFG